MGCAQQIIRKVGPGDFSGLRIKDFRLWSGTRVSVGVSVGVGCWVDGEVGGWVAG